MRVIFVSVLLLFLHVLSSPGQLTPQEAQERLGRGINLGNTLEPPYEGGWNNPPAEERYFDAYKEAGFSTVRIPVRWDKHTAATAPYTIQNSWLDRVEEVADWGLERGMFVIINAHHEEWLKSNYESADTLARFVAIWRQVAERFKDKSDSLLFEIINEPYGMTIEQVDELNDTILKVIRESNPTRIVIYSGYRWSNSEELMQARIPDDPYIMGYFHSYNPWSFAGQGNGTWGTLSDRNQIRDKFQTVGQWARDHGVSIMISEFGAMNGCEFNSRMQHYFVYVQNSLRQHIPFMAWDDGGQFCILCRSSNTWFIIKDILIYTTLESPDWFKAEESGEGVHLTWMNMGEYDTLILERGPSVSTIEPLLGLSPTATAWVDSTAIQGYNYYRLKAYLHDTVFTYSYPVRVYHTPATMVVSPDATGLHLYPNPPKEGTIYLDTGDLPAGIPCSWELFDMKGQSVASGTFVTCEGDIELNPLPGKLTAGTYLFLLHETRRTHTLRLVVD